MEIKVKKSNIFMTGRNQITKKVTEGATIATTEYSDGFQYKDGVLHFFPIAEGYISHSAGNYNYVYHYKDHLGNVRVSYAKDPVSGLTKIVEESNYYPFGMKHANYNDYAPPAPRVANKGYQYKYNGQELQTELGLNVTAMDYRQYDNALGRFLGMDRFAELSFSLTPYRFAFNNPVYWSDPTGLFETKDDAKKWAKTNGIRTGWFSRNKIQESEDGTWAINNKEQGTSIFAINKEDAEALGINVGDVITAPLVEGATNAGESGYKSFGWLTIWGTDRSGDTSGLKGTTTHSVQSSDFITPGISRSLNNKSTGILEWIMSLVYNSAYSSQYGTAIEEAVKKNGNTSTMEVQNLEPVLSPEILIIFLDTTHYHIHLEKKAIEKRIGKMPFKGTKRDIQKSKDSINEKSNYYNNWFNN
ncbi:RHS repeat domain-containing protein [Flavobacterium kingsejongi]|uniref:RHS repeat domain-containing protein n=1 Tax=Flavobacterium kingsejongi TaxID=1678728 RepID=UPI0013008FD0|nr:RHS repeat-associated core domain-containing protein [Flavobacterium kingsejongi]